jgi:hypothetical protein
MRVGFNSILYFWKMIRTHLIDANLNSDFIFSNLRLNGINKN